MCLHMVGSFLSCDLELIAPRVLPAVKTNMRSQYKLPNWADSPVAPIYTDMVSGSKKKELLNCSSQETGGPRVSAHAATLHPQSPSTFSLCQIIAANRKLWQPTEQGFPHKAGTCLGCRWTQPIHRKKRNK